MVLLHVECTTTLVCDVVFKVAVVDQQRPRADIGVPAPPKFATFDAEVPHQCAIGLITDPEPTTICRGLVVDERAFRMDATQLKPHACA